MAWASAKISSFVLPPRSTPPIVVNGMTVSTSDNPATVIPPRGCGTGWAIAISSSAIRIRAMSSILLPTGSLIPIIRSASASLAARKPIRSWLSRSAAAVLAANPSGPNSLNSGPISGGCTTGTPLFPSGNNSAVFSSSVAVAKAGIMAVMPLGFIGGVYGASRASNPVCSESTAAPDAKNSAVSSSISGSSLYSSYKSGRTTFRLAILAIVPPDIRPPTAIFTGCCTVPTPVFCAMSVFGARDCASPAIPC